MTKPLGPQDLPLDAAELRRMIGWRHGPGHDQPKSDVVRVLIRTDPQLLQLALAVNVGLKAGHSATRISQHLTTYARSGMDANLVLAFLRAVGLDLRVRRQGGYAKYHSRKKAEGENLGRSAYTHKRGPARQHWADAVSDFDPDEQSADAWTSDYIRGQGGF